MTGFVRRFDTPAAVERALRQEAGVGCALCGHPYVEYHHIVPYADDPHFRPEDMIALCPTDHVRVAKWSLARQYDLKAKPLNRVRGYARGALDFEKSNLTFNLGGNRMEDFTTLF